MQGRKPNQEAGTATGNDSAGGHPSPPRSPAQLLHDLNQPLGAINNYAQAGIQLIDNGAGDIARLRDLFGKIVAQSGRATVLSQELGKAVKALPTAQDPP